MELSTDKFPQTLFINSLVNDFDPAHEKSLNPLCRLVKIFMEARPFSQVFNTLEFTIKFG